MVAEFVAADTDQSRFRQFLRKNRLKRFTGIAVKFAHGVILDHQSRRVEKHPHESHQLLLVERQFLVPAPLLVKGGSAMAKPEPFECRPHRIVAELAWCGIG